MARKIKNILVCTMDYPPDRGGMETCAFEIVNQLKKYYNVTVLAGRCGKNDYRNEDDIINLNLGFKYLIKIIIIFVHLLRMVLTREIDVIYLNTWSPFGIPVLIINKIFRINYFITAHGLDIVEPVKSRFHFFLMNIVLYNAKTIFAVSRYTKSLIEKYVKLNANNIEVIPNGVNYKQFELKDNSISIRDKYNLKNKFVLLTVSRLVPRKGHLTVIECVKKFIDENFDIAYLIVGQGETKKDIVKMIENYKLEKNVFLTDLIDENELPCYYNQSDIFIMPSKEIIETGDVEGFGVSLLEANAAGLPVITSNTGGCAEAVIHEETGLHVNPESIEEIYNAIKRLINDTGLREKLSINGKKRVRQTLTWDNNVKQMIIYLERN